jgi:phosphate-selective porin
MTSDNTNSTLDLNEKLGLNNMSDAERADFFEDIGTTALKFAYYRFSVSLEEEASKEFQTWMENNADDKDILNMAIDRYPDFAQVIGEEMQAVHDSITRMA